jgi:hypothetical protein
VEQQEGERLGTLEQAERDLIDLEDGVAYWRAAESRAKEEEAALLLAKELLADAGQQAHAAIADPLAARIAPLFATMTAGRGLGLSREATAKYSFMAALPIIGGAAVFGLRDVPLSQLLSLDWVLGFVASTVSSFVAMRWMLAYVRTRSFAIFTIYRLVVGVLVIAVFFLRG